MTDARDELAELIRADLMARAHEDDWGVPSVYPEVISDELADAILAAGTWLPHIPESQIVSPGSSTMSDDHDELAVTWGTPEEWAEFSGNLQGHLMPYVDAIEQWADAVAREARERFGWLAGWRPPREAMGAYDADDEP